MLNFQTYSTPVFFCANFTSSPPTYTLGGSKLFFNHFIDQKQYQNLTTPVELLLSPLKLYEKIKHQSSIVLTTASLRNTMDLLSGDDWKAFNVGDEEIGWMLNEKPLPYPAQKEDAFVHPVDDTKKRDLTFSTENTFHLDEGHMTPEHVHLLLRFLPLDITYVDENDKVIFYNRGDDRVFPRSKGIIQREVKFCHPPKSVHMVIQIVEAFKAGNRDVAEFWFNFRGRMILIRYFAIRDHDKNYKGVIEMSQDITDTQKLEGQKRLLHWD